MTNSRNLSQLVSSANGSILTLSNTTPSTSNATGALVVDGGVGVRGNVYSSTIYTDGLYWKANGNPIPIGENVAAFAQQAFNTANSASSNTIYNSGVDITQNTNINYLVGALNQTNTNIVTANTNLKSYTDNQLTTKVNKSGDTISGQLYISNTSSQALRVDGTVYFNQDLNVTGNIYLNGNATTLSSNNIVLDDSLIYLAANNPSNSMDIGVVGHFVSDHYQHTGIVRDHNDAKWKFFSNVSTEPTNTIDFSEANTVYDTIKVGGVDISNGTANGVLYLNSSKSVTSGTGLVFDGSNVGVGTTNITERLTVNGNIRLDNGTVDGAQVVLASSGYSDWNIDNYNGSLRTYYGSTERMRIDSFGNLGLGVTPSAWASVYKAIQVGLYSAVNYGEGKTNITTNAYYNGTNWIYGASDIAAMYKQGNYHAWYTAPSGTAGAAITFTQAMTLDASGNLGIGTSSPSASAKLTLLGTNTNTSLLLYNGSQSTNTGLLGTVSALLGSGTNNDLVLASFGATQNIAFYNNASELMRITYNGNVGIGTTSPSYKLQVVNGSFYVAKSNSQFLIDVATNNVINHTSVGWGSIQSWTTNNSSGTSYTSMRLDSNGNFLVGTSATQLLYPTALSLSNNSTTLNSNNFITIDNRGTGTTYTSSYTVGGLLFSAYRDVRSPCNIAGIWAQRDSDAGGLSSKGQLIFGTNGALNIAQDGVLPNEAMRIDSSGNLLVGTTSASTTPTAGVVLAQTTSDTYLAIGHNNSGTGSYYVSFARNGGVIGTITQNGTTGVLYNTTSDYRLKENVAPIQDAVSTIGKLNPVTFDWIDDKSADAGFLAHEFQSVLPRNVVGEKDAIDESGNPIYQQMDNSGVVPYLVKAIQELKAELDELKLKVN